MREIELSKIRWNLANRWTARHSRG